MATLDEIIDEQNKIHEELERMASDESTTEDADGGIRDTLVARWKSLDGDREKIVARMEELDLIRKASQDRAGTEAGDAGGRWADGRSPEFMARRNPLAGREESKDYAFLPSLGRDRPRVHADRDARPPRPAPGPPRRGGDAAGPGAGNRPAHADVRRR